MVVQVLPSPPGVESFYRDLNQISGNIAQSFLLGAQMREQTRQAREMAQYREAMLGIRRQEISLRQKPPVAYSREAAQALEAQGLLPPGTAAKIPLPLQSVSPLTQHKVDAWQRIQKGERKPEDLAFLNIDWHREKGKIVFGKEVSAKAPVSGEENPIKAVNPLTGQQETVPAGQTYGQWVDDIIAIKSVNLVEDQTRKIAEAQAKDLQATQLDILKNEAEGNVAAVRNNIISLRKDARKTEENIQKIQSNLALFPPGTVLYNQQATQLRDLHVNLDQIKSSITEAEGKLERTQDIAKTIPLATQLQDLDMIKDEAKAEALIFKMWGQRTIKDRATVNQIYNNYVKGKFSEEAQKRIGQKLLGLIE